MRPRGTAAKGEEKMTRFGAWKELGVDLQDFVAAVEVQREWLIQTRDSREGIQAMAERRPPQFVGE